MLCLSDASAKAIGLSTNTQSFLKNINTGSKLARTAGTAGRVASKASSIAGAVGIGLEVVLQLKGDYDEMLQIEAKKNNRQNIRRLYKELRFRTDGEVHQVGRRQYRRPPQHQRGQV